MPDRGARALLVEHDTDEIELLRAVLAAERLAERLDVVPDGPAALEFLQRDPAGPGALPAVVLLELRLPKLSGFDVLTAVRADARLRLLPVVVLSASTDPDDVRRSYALGANGYVIKPVAFADYRVTVCDTVRYWLSRNTPLPRS
jgi:CheY-like chemotaxis protein